MYKYKNLCIQVHLLRLLKQNSNIAAVKCSNMEMLLEALVILSNGILFLSYNKQFGGS